jgi:C1A family cysteine protease
MKRFYGWKPQKPDFRDKKLTLVQPPILPSMVDLRPLCPPVYDQGQLGSCTANGLAGAVEFLLGKEKLPDFMPSRLFIYYNERVLEGTIRTDAGANIRDGIKSLASQGVCDEKLWPYKIGRFTYKPCKKCYSAALPNIIEKYEAVTSLQDYKVALSNGVPVPFGFTVYESFESDEVAKTGIVPVPGSDEQAMGGHCTDAVGYDDSKKCLIVRNSWGPGWGDKGYFYLPYQFFNLDLISDGWAIYLVK